MLSNSSDMSFKTLQLPRLMETECASHWTQTSEIDPQRFHRIAMTVIDDEATAFELKQARVGSPCVGETKFYTVSGSGVVVAESG